MIATALAALVFSAAGCGGRTAADVVPAGSAAAQTVDRVTAGPPQRVDLTITTSQPGRIEAFETTPLYPKLSGYIAEYLADIGDRIETDQVLIRLWVPELTDELHQKEALLAQADAQVQQAEAAAEAAQAAVETARARVAEAEAGVTRAEGEYRRWESEDRRLRELAERGSVSTKLSDETRSQFQAATAARQAAQAAVRSSTAAVRQAEADLVKAQADTAAARAGRQVAASNQAYTQTQADYREIKAPYDGIVTQRNVNLGDYVQPANGSGGTKPLMVVAHADRVRIFVDVPEDEAALVDRRDPATIRVQALRGAERTGTVTRTSWALNPANRSLHVEIDLDNADGHLRPGLYATAEIQLESRENVLTLPAAALVRDAGQTFVYCIRAGKAIRTPVTTGLRSGDQIEIVEGLTEQDMVVLARAATLKDGQPVEVLPMENPK